MFVFLHRPVRSGDVKSVVSTGFNGFGTDFGHLNCVIEPRAENRAYLLSFVSETAIFYIYLYCKIHKEEKLCTVMCL